MITTEHLKIKNGVHVAAARKTMPVFGIILAFRVFQASRFSREMKARYRSNQVDQGPEF